MTSDNPTADYPLFEQFPSLSSKLPRVALGNFPTPVKEASELASSLGIGRLFIKRDDLTHGLYGGNKVRKLELILADAEIRGYKSVITYGGIGSNHFLATTVHASARGMKSIGVLVPQPVTATVKKNLLLDLHFGAEIHLAQGYSDAAAEALRQMLRHTIMDGRPPYNIPTGGSSISGVIGYINAAFELKKQIERGELPEPDMIFVAVGTCGTASGLIAGCHAAGLKTKVIGVKVTDWVAGNSILMASLANQATLKLFSIDRRFPLRFLAPFNIDLLTEYFGDEYGRLTHEGMEAVDTVKEFTGLKLEGVYTGKAFAGLIGASKKQDLSNKTVLFWNTYNSADLSSFASQHDYHELPKEFQYFFEVPEHTVDDLH